MLIATRYHNNRTGAPAFIPRAHELNKYELLKLLMIPEPGMARSDVVAGSIMAAVAAVGFWPAWYTIPNMFSAYTSGGHVGFAILNIFIGLWIAGWMDISIYILEPKKQYRSFRTNRAATRRQAIAYNDKRWVILRDYFNTREQQGYCNAESKPAWFPRMTWERLVEEMGENSTLSRELDEILIPYFEDTYELTKLLTESLTTDEKVAICENLAVHVRRTGRKLLLALDEHNAPSAQAAFAQEVEAEENAMIMTESQRLVDEENRRILSQRVEMALESAAM